MISTKKQQTQFSQSPQPIPDTQATETKKRKKYRSKEFTFITYLFFVVFLGMMAYYVYFIGFASEDFINSPYNGLQDIYADSVIRGDITTEDGYVIATSSVDSDGTETRDYPYGREFAHVVGYAVNGKSGLESQYNFSLLRSHEFFLERIVNDLSGQKNQGDTLVTTLNFELQEVAYDALGDYDGAVIVMQPSTGKILCMVSKPDFNPNSVSENWDEITEEGSTVLYNRATQGQYAPGSTFKILTTLEYYRENPLAYLNYSFSCTGEYTYDGKTIHCSNGHVHGDEDLVDSFAHSCNCSYANVSLSLNMDSFMETLDGALFNTDLPVDFESNSSKVSISNTDTASAIMETGIGQGSTYVSPLHMVMLASAIDNGGVLMTPYLVDHVENASGITVSQNSPKGYGALMTTDEAAVLQTFMAAVTDYGTADALSGQSYDAFGKTGTAQVSDSTDQTNAWFVGYAEKSGYDDIAIAVIVEDSGAGSTYAVPIAKKIFDAYFN